MTTATARDDVLWLPREWWGADRTPDAGHAVDHDRFVGLAVHHTVAVVRDWDGDGIIYGDLDDIARYMRWLKTARPDLGDDVPYSWVVFEGEGPRSAIVVEGRGWGRTGAHTAGYNSTRYGAALAGNSSHRVVTAGVLEGFRAIGRQLADPAGAEPTFGHRDVRATECPGSSLYADLPLIQPPFPVLVPAGTSRPPEVDTMRIADCPGKPALYLTPETWRPINVEQRKALRAAGVPAARLELAEWEHLTGPDSVLRRAPAAA